MTKRETFTRDEIVARALTTIEVGIEMLKRNQPLSPSEGGQAAALALALVVLSRVLEAVGEPG